METRINTKVVLLAKLLMQ